MRRLAGLALPLILLLGAPLTAAETPVPPELRALVERLDGQAAAEWGKDRLGGVTVGLVSGGDLVWTKSYGAADMEKKLPATTRTIYRIGSVTKQFTALMLLQLVEAGKVHFSDPVEKYFPEVNKIQGRLPGSPPITLIQLATHTSGLDSEPGDTATYLKGPVGEWEKVLLAALPRTRYVAEPGTLFNYSNVGYAILGAALARAAGQPYVEYVEQRIFKPLGMTDTYFEPDDRMRPRLARGYLSEDGKLDFETAEREHQGRGYKVPNGAVYSTVGDLARFVAFETGKEASSVLKPESLDESFDRLVTANASFQRGYGTGFQVLRAGDAVLYGHTGGVAGYQSQAFFNRKSRMGLIVLWNVVGGPFDATRLVRSALRPAPPEAGTPKPK